MGGCFLNLDFQLKLFSEGLKKNLNCINESLNFLTLKIRGTSSLQLKSPVFLGE